MLAHVHRNPRQAGNVNLSGKPPLAHGTARLATVCALAALLLHVPVSAADVVFNVNGGFLAMNAATATKIQPSFTLPTQPADVKDAIDEFQRLVKHEQWEKAFKSLETIAGKTSNGFLDRGDGVLLPSRMLVRSLLAGLPAAGKSAYRLFYDSAATALWDKAVDKVEADNLAAIVANHLISSVGDRAADRLGDLYFERGDIEPAIVAWRSLVDYCPDSKISKAQTLVKMAMALARGGRWAEFADVERSLRERYAAESVVLGGKQLAALELIDRLAAMPRGGDAGVEKPLPDDFELPTSIEPAWRFPFQSKADPLNQNQPFNLVDVYGRQRANDFLIPAAVDDKRVYVNLFGVEMAFNLDSGKLAWRSGKLHLLQLQQARQGAAPERYSLSVADKRTWSVLRDPQQNNQMAGFALIVREADTGKEVFNTRRTLSAWNILGEPYPHGDVVYVGASRANQGRELAVLVLSSKDGKLLKTITVGNHAVDQNQIYSERIAQPSFLVYRDRLYVDTHSGALVSLQPQTGNVDWGILYESANPQTGYYYDYIPPHFGSSAPLRAGGLVFCKGMRATRLLGVQTDGPNLAWNRPVAKSAVILSADDEHIYLGGEELLAYSLKTQELVWSTQLPHSAGWSTPLVTKNRLYQFTSRGVCEIDKRSGNVLKIFRGDDLDSYGGSLFVTPQALVTVSNLAITAYPLPAGPQEPSVH